MVESEEIEKAALCALHHHTTDDLRLELGLSLIDESAGTISMAGELPASAIVINRGFGLLPTDPNGRDLIREAIESYRQRNIARYFLQFTHAQEVDETFLNSMGLVPARAWQKFELQRNHYHTEKSTLPIEKVTGSAQACAQIICAGFDLGESAQRWLSQLPEIPNWHLFAVNIDGQTAACAGLFVKDHHAWLDFAATAPQFRGRGCQSALIHARLQFAFDLGCHTAVSCTGVEVKGDPQHSFHNLLRAGFKPTYIRENWAPGNLN